jgi:CRP-like cAMP-binding protein
MPSHGPDRNPNSGRGHLFLDRAPATRPGWKLKMSEDFLGLFASVTEVITLASGETLFEKGQPWRLMYVVKAGSLRVIDGNHIHETGSAGGIIGEMALVDARSATVRASERST